MNARLTLPAAAFALMASSCSWPSIDDSPEPLQPGPALSVAWSLDGHWGGIAAPPGSPTAYGNRSGELVAIRVGDGFATPTGSRIESRVRVGTRKGEAMIVSFNPWGYAVRGHTIGGQDLWTFRADGGIDDAWPADLDGDGDSETIVGLNGGGGVLALDRDGKVLWTNKSIGNVWNVAAGRPDAGEELRIVTTSARGGAHVFTTTGEHVRDVPARFYATEIRLGDRTFVAGSADAASFVATLAPAGWMTRVSGRATATDTLAARPSVPWVAVSTISGNVYALNASTGAVEGAASGITRGAELDWATPEKGSAVLLVASGNGLRAYRVGTPPAGDGR